MHAASPFFAKLEAAAHRRNSLACVGLDLTPEQIPARYRGGRGDVIADLLAWTTAIVEQTAEFVCAFKPNSAFYEALGPAGAELLAATLALIPPDLCVILDAKRGDVRSTAAVYAQAVFAHPRIDAVTVHSYLGRDSVEPFLDYTARGVFVLCHTSNPGAADFQELEISDWRTLDREPNQPLYVHVARAAAAWAPNVGLVVGATYPEAVRRVRQAAPDSWFLVPGIGAQGGDLESTVDAGLRADGLGLIINASRSISGADNHGRAAAALRDGINAVREQRAVGAPDAASRSASAPAVLTGLVELGAVKFGDFTLASGMHSPIYIDLRLLVGKPALLAQVAEHYAVILASLACDRIAGVPYAALPIGTAVSLCSGVPMVYPRKEVKAHGLGREIEGVWQPGERVVIIEDLITSGGSTVTTAERLRAAGLIVEHVIVLIDREQGGVEKLAAAGITAHSVYCISEMVETLVGAGTLGRAQADDVYAFIRQAQV